MAAEILGPAVVRGISAATKSNGLLIGSSHLARVLLTGRSLRDATPNRVQFRTYNPQPEGPREERDRSPGGDKPHPQVGSSVRSITSIDFGEISSSTNPGISGDDTVSICISST